MDLAGTIESRSDPVAAVEVRQAHVSVVFLSGAFAYKAKKPVAMAFLDFTAREDRRDFCTREVALNRRLAGDVYLGVVPVTRDGSRTQLEGRVEVVEWAVKMRRPPDDATLPNRLNRDAVDRPLVEMLARRVAAFHAGAADEPARPVRPAERRGGRGAGEHRPPAGRTRPADRPSRLRGPRGVRADARTGRCCPSVRAKVLPATRPNVAEARAAYSNNRVPFLNLVEAQRGQTALKDRYYEAQAEVVRRRATLERAVGGPLPTAARP